MEALLTVYLGIGLLVAGYFSFYKINKVDSAATHAPLGFRLIIIPGVILLWPLIIRIKKVNHS